MGFGMLLHPRLIRKPASVDKRGSRRHLIIHKFWGGFAVLSSSHNFWQNISVLSNCDSDLKKWNEIQFHERTLLWGWQWGKLTSSFHMKSMHCSVAFSSSQFLNVVTIGNVHILPLASSKISIQSFQLFFWKINVNEIYVLLLWPDFDNKLHFFSVLPNWLYVELAMAQMRLTTLKVCKAVGSFFLVLPLPRWAASPTVVSCPEQMTVARNRPFGAARVRSKLINVTKPFSADHIQQLAVTRPSSAAVGWNVIKIFSTGILAAQYSEKRWGGFISSFSCGGWSPVVLADLSASLKLLSATESRSLSNGTSSQWH